MKRKDIEYLHKCYDGIDYKSTDLAYSAEAIEIIDRLIEQAEQHNLYGIKYLDDQIVELIKIDAGIAGLDYIGVTHFIRLHYDEYSKSTYTFRFLAKLADAIGED